MMLPEWNSKDKRFTRFIHIHVHPMEYQVRKTGCAGNIKPLLLIFVPLHLLEGVKLVTMMGKWGIALVQFVIKIEGYVWEVTWYLLIEIHAILYIVH